MITSNPLQMRIEAFGDDAFSFLYDQYEKRVPICIGDKEFLPTAVERKSNGGEEATQARLDVMQITRMQMPWTGEGLPPFGTVCEWFSGSTRSWLIVKIAYQSSWVVVVQDTKDRLGNAEHGPTEIALEIDRDHPKFRPIRTAEQIAAEKREAGVTEMRRVWSLGSEGDKFTALWDAGYRKQEHK